jgi:hypothetical protein
MSKKRKVTKGNPMAPKVTWTAFQQVTPEPNLKAREIDPEGYDELQKAYEIGIAKMFQNSLYTIHVRYLNTKKMAEGAQWLSIRSNDRKAIHDWRHFQRIKNELVGDEREAVEIYPRESQMVDEANTYHLWVLDSADTMPFGFKTGRRVGGSEEAQTIGAGQRDFE